MSTTETPEQLAAKTIGFRMEGGVGEGSIQPMKAGKPVGLPLKFSESEGWSFVPSTRITKDKFWLHGKMGITNNFGIDLSSPKDDVWHQYHRQGVISYSQGINTGGTFCLNQTTGNWGYVKTLSSMDAAGNMSIVGTLHTAHGACTGSDLKLKKLVIYTDKSKLKNTYLDKIDLLDTARFTYKDDEKRNSPRQLGWIAQDVQAVFPDAVRVAEEDVRKPLTKHVTKETTLYLNNSYMAAITYEGVRELNRIRKEQAQTITQLTETVNTQAQELERMRQFMANHMSYPLQ